MTTYTLLNLGAFKPADQRNVSRFDVSAILGSVILESKV